MSTAVQFDFKRYADSLAANVEASERIIGRQLSNSEANQVAMMVGRIQGEVQRAEAGQRRENH